MSEYAVGPSNAKIMLIGECWGEQEEVHKQPFVGMAGKVLDAMLEEAGLRRTECYITNVVHRRPPNNNFGVFYNGKAPTEELIEAYTRLYTEIARVKPHVIVALGNEALKALTDKDGIVNWRGSILATRHGKVIPTIHPASVAREWVFRPAGIADLRRVKEQAAFPNVIATHRQLTIANSLDEALSYLNSIKEGDHVAVDIEVETAQITCIGFCKELHRAFTIPFWRDSSGSFFSAIEETQIWEAIRRLLNNPNIGKIFHNATYDMGYLHRTLGIRVRGLWMDSMCAWHVLQPELPKELAFVTSLYTDQPYYKHLIKSDSVQTYFEYNCLDACITYEIATKLYTELTEDGLWEFYQSHVHALIGPLFRMMLRGVRWDKNKAKELLNKLSTEVVLLQQNLDKMVGHTINVASPQKMATWLYDELKLPKKYKRRDNGTRTLTTDEEAIDELYQQTGKEELKTIIEIRERQKLISTYLEARIDPDSRIRCSYLITGTETGRLSSRATPWGTGTNLQNIPTGELRRLFLADPGKVFINADLSQAEARVVAYLAAEERLIAAFNNGGDIHKKNAANIFKVKEKEVTDDQRQLAKKVVHASNYGMGPRTFSKQAGISEKDATRLLNQYFSTYPRIKFWHTQVQDTLQRTREVSTPTGRRRIFYNRFKDGLLRETLAYVPQSTVADILNQGLIEFEREATRVMGIQCLLQVHDSILAQCDDTPQMLKATIRLLRRCLTRPITINGRVMTIPVDIKIGYNWCDMTKYEEV